MYHVSENLALELFFSSVSLLLSCATPGYVYPLVISPENKVFEMITWNDTVTRDLQCQAKSKQNH